MAKQRSQGRPNQRHRTRKDLLTAAARLLKSGRMPDMDAVAREAMVSRATAYRYFPTIESLLIEAPLDDAILDPKQLFANDSSSDPETRIDKAEAMLHKMCYANEAQLRAMLAASLTRHADASNGVTVPVRQNRRTPLIETALSPARNRFSKSSYRTLCAALAVIFGTESMIVFSDVLGISHTRARQIKSWATRSLVRAALHKHLKE
jgi:AcrR family transcriptional regulator